MNKIIILQGLPGSGKSTYAKELIDKNPGKYKRVNKDDLRAMIDNGKYSKANEKFVLEMRDAFVDLALINGYDVIVDDTNFEWKHVERMFELAEINEAEVEIKKIETDLNECIKRDLKRHNSVGEKVIKSMYNRYVVKQADAPKYLEDKPTAVICDIDGTLAHMQGRSPYDWSKVCDDTIDSSVKYLLSLITFQKHNIINKPKIIIVSGRDSVCREKTIEWLERNKIQFDALLMREAGDNRKDTIVKKELYKKYIQGNCNVLFVLDDRTQVVDMWRSLGLKCYQVAPGDF